MTDHPEDQPPPRKLSKAECGRLGGRQTKARHGTEHFRKAGKLGFAATVARTWQGDRAGYIRFLHARGFLADIQRLMSEPDAPSSIEIPPIPGLEEEDLPW